MPEPREDGPVNIVAYHFLPSPEVGAKRMTALASCLRDANERVVIFSAFEGIETLDPDDWRRRFLHNLELEQVPDPPSAIIGFLVRTKQVFKARWCVVRGLTPPEQSRSRPIRAGTQQTRPVTARRLFFAVVHVVDDKKRWSLRMAGRVFSASQRTRPGVIVVSGPPMSSVIGATLAARLLRVPLIVDLRDPIVAENELRVADEGLPNQWGRKTLERFAVSRASAIVTTSPTLRSRLSSRYPQFAQRIRCIYNGLMRRRWRGRLKPATGW